MFKYSVIRAKIGGNPMYRSSNVERRGVVSSMFQALKDEKDYKAKDGKSFQVLQKENIYKGIKN